MDPLHFNGQMSVHPVMNCSRQLRSAPWCNFSLFLLRPLEAVTSVRSNIPTFQYELRKE